MRQVDIMLEGEADAMYVRQQLELGMIDHVTDLVEELNLQRGTVLEIGCSNGWRLIKFRDEFNSSTLGVDPSTKAAADGLKNGLTIRRGTADRLPLLHKWADLLIYGFCLYITDPEDWLRIAAEGDRVLRPGGHLIVHDFAANDGITKVVYKHDPRLHSHHFDFSRLWLAHPHYALIRRRLFGDEMVTILRKRA